MHQRTAEGFQIRMVQRPDLPALYKIDREAFGAIGNDFVTIRQMYDIAQNCFFVGEDCGQLVGYAVGCMKFGSDDGWLLDLAVLPTKQGLGYGKRLAQSVICALSKAGCKTIRLVVHPQNTALKLYEKFGFREESREPDYYATGERMVMVCHLTGV